ncbi:MAG: hypothetical protein HYY24_05990 [Verrucomicrobia bacterium]|nr:hypothetical protein [Verrucomicrobiota bacterium]
MKNRLRQRTPLTSSSATAPESASVREQLTFRQQRQRLSKRSAGEYVALQGGRVVAHDRDDEALAARLFGRVGDAPFFITPVGETPLTVEVPSPELAR